MQYGMLRRVTGVLAAVLLVGSPLVAQTFTHLFTFDETDGSFGNQQGMVLAQGYDGNLYGTSMGGGEYSYGTIFRLTPTGTVTTLYTFIGNLTHQHESCCPPTGLTLGNDGNFYGVAQGGTEEGGVPFKIDPIRGCGLPPPSLGCQYTVIYNFCSSSSCPPRAGPAPIPLILGRACNFYGATTAGGKYDAGTIYRITPTGTVTVLHAFCSIVQDGSCVDYSPAEGGGMIQGSDGNIYGTVNGYENTGGGLGYVFKLTPTGRFTILYTFCEGGSCYEGGNPSGGLAEGNDGNYYGMTEYGGVYGSGTIFEITPAGAYTQLHAFCSDVTFPNCPHDGFFRYPH